MRADPVDVRLLAAAALCAGAAIALGFAVASREPGRLDVAGFALRDHGVALALALTTLGRGLGTAIVLVLGFAVAFALRRGADAVAAIAVAQVLSQAVNAALKPLFHRARPVEWFGYREHDLSFPSGHATTAVVVYAGLALLAYGGLPRAAGVPLAVLFVAVGAGIAWSRLALGAHYVTDVAAGALMGTAWLLATLAVLRHLPSIAASTRG